MPFEEMNVPKQQGMLSVLPCQVGQCSAFFRILKLVKRIQKGTKSYCYGSAGRCKLYFLRGFHATYCYLLVWNSRMAYFQAQLDPWHFGTLGRSMITLFRATTMDDWTDIYYINSFGCDY